LQVQSTRPGGRPVAVEISRGAGFNVFFREAVNTGGIAQFAGNGLVERLLSGGEKLLP